MTPNEFVLEHWKVYQAYMGRKEHLIEVTATVYLAFVSALLLQSWQQFWLVHVRPVAILGLLAALLAWWFVYLQFRFWTNAARICNSCQTLMAEWLANPDAPKDLTPIDLPNSPGIKAPKALVDVVNERIAEWEKKGCCDKVCSSSFEVIVYGLGAVWTLALLVQCCSAFVAQTVALHR